MAELTMAYGLWWILRANLHWVINQHSHHRGGLHPVGNVDEWCYHGTTGLRDKSLQVYYYFGLNSREPGS